MEWLRVDPSTKELRYLHFANPAEINMNNNANLGEKEFWNSISFNENVLESLQPNTRKEEL